MTLRFVPAEKQRAKLRLGLYGPSGAGKTLTALRLATGMDCGKIAVIDTERGSASLYADRYAFDVLDLPKTDIETYTQAISLAAEAGYPLLIIDSLTHAWHDLLARVDRIAKTRFKGNKWSAWSEATPVQRSLVGALLGYPGHIIATMRTKTEWAVDRGDDGKLRPVRMGLAPEQGKGIEYEFSLLMEINLEHVVTVTKDRTGEFQDQSIEKPGEELGQQLMEWLNSGAEPTVRADPKPEPKAEAAAKSKAGNGQSVSGTAWIENERSRKAFWASTHDKGLSHEEVHTALGVESLKDYQGTPTMAHTAIDKWIAGQVDGEGPAQESKAIAETEAEQQEAMPL